jgi:hypothetical protein
MVQELPVMMVELAWLAAASRLGCQGLLVKQCLLQLHTA